MRNAVTVTPASRPSRLPLTVKALVLAASAALLLVLTAGARTATAEQPVVRAVLFYSTSCPHCHQVITFDLPPLQRQYGDSLQIAALDVDDDTAYQLYESAMVRYGVGGDRRGVPALYVGGQVLVGSEEIPRILPGLVESILAQGGSEWPAIPGLDPIVSDPAAIPTLPPYAAELGLDPEPSEQTSPVSEAIDRAAEDPVGSTLSIMVLLGLITCLAWSGSVAWRSDPAHVRSPSRLIPIVALIELGVAAYMASVEIGGSAAVCGPVGDCNRVHQSEYASLFGLLPVGVFGVAGSIVILATWAAGRLAEGMPAWLARLGLLAASAFGVAFSAYLTFLEPLVIGATCAWCLTSAILMGAILILATVSMWPQPVPRAPTPRRRRSRRAGAGYRG
jgi:uncharacterized membrane protein/glutaredoxin